MYSDIKSFYFCDHFIFNFNNECFCYFGLILNPSGKNSLSNADTALLHWAKSDEGKLAKDLARWNSRGLTSKGKTLICEQEAANLDVTLTLEGKSVDSGWCALWIRPADKR